MGNDQSKEIGTSSASCQSRAQRNKVRRYRCQKSQVSTGDSGYDTVTVSHHDDGTATDKSHIDDILRKLQDIQKSCDEDKLVNKYVEKGNFSAGFFTRLGGTLKIGNRVCLYIPPDALPETGVYLIYIYIDSTCTEDRLTDDTQWVTPVVECGPDGQQFRRNVLLSVRMYDNISHDVLPASTIGHCTNSTGERKRDWRQLENDVSIQEAEGRRVVFEVDHFTGFAASGTTSSDARETAGEEVKETKTITGAVFVVTNEEQEGDVVRVRWCDFPHYEHMLQKEDALYMSDRNSILSLQVENSDKDVVFRLVKNHHENTSGNGIQIQYIKVRDIWKCQDGELSFYMEYKISKDTFVEVFQNGHPTEKILLTPLAVNATSNGSMETDAREEVVFLKRQPDLDPSPESLHFISDEAFRRLCIILEGMENVGMLNQGWKMLAEKCGIKEYKVVACIEMRARYQQRSPAAIVLDHFFRSECWDKAYDALTSLRNMLCNMGNHDAQMVVDDEIAKRLHTVIHCESSNSLTNTATVPRHHRGSISQGGSHTKGRSIPDSLPVSLQVSTRDTFQDAISYESADHEESNECSCFGILYCGFKQRGRRKPRLEDARMSLRSNFSGESGYSSDPSTPIREVRTESTV